MPTSMTGGGHFIYVVCLEADHALDRFGGIGGGTIGGGAEQVAACLTVDAIKDITRALVGRCGLYG